MAIQTNNYGHKTVILYGKDGFNKSTTEKIALLVAKYFVPNPHNYSYIDFLDGNPANCRADNIVWVELTQKQIKQYQYKQKRVNRYDLKGKYIDTFEGLKKAAFLISEDKKNIKEIKRNTSGISTACKHRKKYGGYQWRYADDIEIGIDIEPYKTKERLLYQFDKDTKELIRKFETIEDVAEYLGKQASAIQANIYNCCYGNRPTAYGFYWSFENVPYSNIIKKGEIENV